MYNIKLSDNEIAQYSAKSINKLFAILGIFEECQENNDMSTLYTYLDRLIVEFNGTKYTLDVDTFVSLVSILAGIRNKGDITHKEVKSLVFHCISLVKKGVG